MPMRAITSHGTCGFWNSAPLHGQCRKCRRRSMPFERLFQQISTSHSSSNHRSHMDRQLQELAEVRMVECTIASHFPFKAKAALEAAESRVLTKECHSSSK